MMNKDNIITELNELSSQKLISSYSMDNNFISIITLEDILIKIDTDFRTYYKLINISDNNLKNYIGENYESFEQILSHLSQEYNSTFNKSLYDKLLELQKEQTNNDNKD